MALRITAASQQAICNTSPPVTAYPLTLMCWACPLTGVGDGSVYVFGNTSDSLQWLGIDFTSASGWYLPASTGGGGSQDTGFIAHSLGRWDFIVARCISATNRRLSVLTSQGAVTHVQSTGSATPSINRLTIGKFGNAVTTDQATGGWFQGRIAECTLIGADIQPDGAQLEDRFLRDLAHKGPFAFPHLHRDILEYRSFRSSVLNERPGETWFGRRGRQSWSPITAVPAIDAHPPLLGSAKRAPAHPRAPLVIV